MNNLEKRINNLLRKVMNKQTAITPEKKLVEDLGLSSLKLMKLMGLVENEFDIIVPVNKALEIENVSELYDGIKKIISGEKKNINSD